MENQNIDSKTVLDVIGDSGDKRWYTAMLMYENGNYQKAAKVVNDIITDPDNDYARKAIVMEEVNEVPTGTRTISVNDNIKAMSKDLNEIRMMIDGMMYNAIIAKIANMGVLKKNTGDNVVTMLKSVTDAGLPDFAYNLANTLFGSAKTKSDFELVQHYYQIAMNDEDPSIRAAAFVNYCPIVRDGLITGVKDHKKAVEIYAQAGELGQVTGMFNAANVSDWLINDGHHEYCEVMAHWAERLLKRKSDSTPLLQSDVDNNTDKMVDDAKMMLCKVHVSEMIKNADPLYGLQLCESVTDIQPHVKAWYFDRAYGNTIKNLNKPSTNSGADNWAYVLSAMGWTISDVKDHANGVGMMYIEDETTEMVIPLLVVDGDILGDKAGSISKGCNIFIKKFKEKFQDHYLIAQKIAAFHETNGQVYTPIIAVSNGFSRYISIYPGMSTKDLFETFIHPRPFIDGVSFSNSCVISIAINKLNSGESVREEFNYNDRFSIKGEWGIPHLIMSN